MASLGLASTRLLLRVAPRTQPDASTHSPAPLAQPTERCTTWCSVLPCWAVLHVTRARATVRVNIRILTRRNLASNSTSVDEDLRAQVKARRVSRRAPTRARVMWTHLKSTGHKRHCFCRLDSFFSYENLKNISKEFCLLSAFGFFFGITFDAEDWGEIFFRNVHGLQLQYMVLYSRGQNSS
jgi:hypothetical protein